MARANVIYPDGSAILESMGRRLRVPKDLVADLVEDGVEFCAMAAKVSRLETKEDVLAHTTPRVRKESRKGRPRPATRCLRVRLHMPDGRSLVLDNLAKWLEVNLGREASQAMYEALLRGRKPRGYRIERLAVVIYTNTHGVAGEQTDRRGDPGMDQPTGIRPPETGGTQADPPSWDSLDRGTQIPLLV